MPRQRRVSTWAKARPCPAKPTAFARVQEPQDELLILARSRGGDIRLGPSAHHHQVPPPSAVAPDLVPLPVGGAGRHLSLADHALPGDLRDHAELLCREVRPLEPGGLGQLHQALERLPVLGRAPEHVPHRLDLAVAAVRDRADACLFRLPRPLGAGLAHHLPDADALHAVRCLLHVQARVPRWPDRLGYPDPPRHDRVEPRDPILDLDEPGDADPRRCLAVDAVPLHHLRRGPSGSGRGDRGGRAARRRLLARDLLQHLTAR